MTYKSTAAALAFLFLSTIHAAGQSPTHAQQVTSARIDATADGDDVVVLVTNYGSVQLDAWEPIISVQTTSGPQTLRLRHDFYRSAALGDQVGQNAIQPMEQRKDRIHVTGLVSVVEAKLAMLIFRDGKSEGDQKSRNELAARRQSDVVELEYWLDVLKKVDDSSDAISSSRLRLKELVDARGQTLPIGVDPVFAKSIRDNVTVLVSLSADRFRGYLAHQVELLGKERAAATVVK